MKIELTKKQTEFLLEMINVLNFPGREVETVYEVKKIIVKSLTEKTTELPPETYQEPVIQPTTTVIVTPEPIVSLRSTDWYKYLQAPMIGTIKMVRVTRANVRQSPSITARILTTITKGNEYQVLATRKDSIGWIWLQIRPLGTTNAIGWSRIDMFEWHGRFL